MKQTLFLLSLLSTLLSFGQNPIVQIDSFKTKIEQELNAKNVLIKKEYIELERIKKVDFKFIRVYNFETKDTTKGLYVSTKSRCQKNTHYIDSAEIVRILNYLLAMDTTNYNYNLNNELIYNIRSKDNFNIVMSYDTNDWVWKYSMFLNKHKFKKKGRRLKEKQFKLLIGVFANANGLM